MDKKVVFFGILASILIGGSFGMFPIQDSFAQDDSDRLEEKAQKEKDRLEEKAQKEKDRLEEKAQKEKDRLEEKAQKEKDRLEEKAQKEKDRLEEKAQKEKDRLEEKKAKLEYDRKKLEEKIAKKINKYEDKLKEIKEKYQNRIDSSNAKSIEKFSAATAKLEHKIEEKSEQIRQKLQEKTEKLDTRTQKILDEINDGDYLGKKIGSSTISDTYELVFDSVIATAINDKTQTSSLTGIMSFTTFDKGKSNLKLELDECQIIVDDIPFNCGFGKARTVSSGDSGAKDSLVIIAFLQDDVLEDVHSTLKIYLNADVPISKISDSSQVSILGPQSKISSMWFLEGTGTLTKTNSGSDDSGDADGNKFSVTLTEKISIDEQ